MTRSTATPLSDDGSRSPASARLTPKVGSHSKCARIFAQRPWRWRTAMGSDESDDDEEVGYCKPPKWTRFTSGKSGNPKVRPRKSRAQQAAAIAEGATDDILRGE